MNWQAIADERNRTMPRPDIRWQAKADGMFLTDCPQYAARHHEWITQRAEAERQAWLRNYRDRTAKEQAA